ncbi:homing endonuclease associated repeat-containing protein [Cytobacillus gottheilii]|uniref:homing endonuclease associated repeat-containing protein n=1 Tax=Cytobacillus gottheilii TaxID=859144 RepID=UPI00111B6B1E|nr:hypothetical protein [Cytobacillus gottheilii]
MKAISPLELIKVLQEYYIKYDKVPSVDEINNDSNLPSQSPFISKFGSYKNALKAAGLYELKKDNKRKHGDYSDEALLEKLRIFISSKERIPYNNEVRIGMSPSLSVYERRFGSYYNALKMIGYDIGIQKQADTDRKRKSMLEKYKELAASLQRTPTSRDIAKAKKDGFGYSVKAYTDNFGSINELQLLSQVNPTVLRKIDKDKMLKDLVRMSEELGRSPLMVELPKFSNVFKASTYLNYFGSWNNALIEAGLSTNKRQYYSKNGDACLSYYELIIANYLYDKKFNYRKEVRYSDYIDTKRNYRFDFMVESKGENIFIEIFGIVGKDDYYIKTEDKINLCRQSNIHLVEIYPTDFKSHSIDEILSPLHATVKDKVIALV